MPRNATFYNLRKRLKLTQSEIAEKLGITRAYYGQLETGDKEPSKTLEQMMQLMEQIVDAAPEDVSEEDAAYGKTKASDIFEYMQPWMEAAKRHADVTPYALTILRKHLPHSDIDELFK